MIIQLQKPYFYCIDLLPLLLHSCSIIHQFSSSSFYYLLWCIDQPLSLLHSFALAPICVFGPIRLTLLFLFLFFVCYFSSDEVASFQSHMLILAHHHGYDPLLTRGLLWIINAGRPYKPNCIMEKECQICLWHTVAQIVPDMLFLECRAHHFSPQ